MGLFGVLAPKMGKMMDKTWKNRKIANKKRRKKDIKSATKPYFMRSSGVFGEGAN